MVVHQYNRANKMITDKLEKLLGSGNLKKYIPATIYREINAIFSPCCGLGRKTVRIVDANGAPAKITSYPVTIDGDSYGSERELEDGMASNYGTGHVVKVLNPILILVIGNVSTKNAVGVPNIADTVVKS